MTAAAPTVTTTRVFCSQYWCFPGTSYFLGSAVLTWCPTNARAIGNTRSDCTERPARSGTGRPTAARRTGSGWDARGTGAGGAPRGGAAGDGPPIGPAAPPPTALARLCSGPDLERTHVGQ